MIKSGNYNAKWRLIIKQLDQYLVELEAADKEGPDGKSIN
jgi:hypothetical protein